MSQENAELLRGASIEDTFFGDQELVNSLRELEVTNLDQLSKVELDRLMTGRRVGISRIEAVARMLRAVGVERIDLFDHINGEKKVLGPDEELLARYSAVGAKLVGTLYIHELKEPDKTYETEKYLKWMRDRRLNGWRDLMLELSAERKRDRRVSMALGSLSGRVYDRTYTRKDPHLTIKELRGMDADSLVRMAEVSKWRGVKKPQAELVLKIFTPVKE